MAFDYHLTAVVRSLQQRVLPVTTDADGKAALETAIRALVGLADALGEAPDSALPACVASETVPVHLPVPPDNAAARVNTAAAIAMGVARLAEGAWLEGGAAADEARALIAWERDLLRAFDSRVRAAESVQPSAAAGNPLRLDRDALERWLKGKFGASVEVTAFRQAAGGRSRQTALFTIEGTDALPARLVIQRDHPAGISPYNIVHEFPVLEHLNNAAVLSPRVLALELDRAAMGAPFMIAEQIPGQIVSSAYFDPPAVPGIALQLARQLALLHSVDPAPVAAGRHHTLGPGDSWVGELDRIEAAWERLKQWPSISVTAALGWMRRQVDRIGPELAIIHNDTALHNLLAENGELTALLDWELVHIGHPGEDLGYCRPFIETMMPWSQFVDAYVAAGGRRFEPEVLDYFALRGVIYLMTLLQGGRSHFESGATDDANLAEVASNFMPRLSVRIANVLAAVLGENR